jgi:hypothetical protein
LLGFHLFTLVIVEVSETECNKEIFDWKDDKDHNYNKVIEQCQLVIRVDSLLYCPSSHKKSVEKTE